MKPYVRILSQVKFKKILVGFSSTQVTPHTT